MYGDDPAVQIAEYARVSGVTKIVLGRTNHRSLLFFKGKSLADRLTDLAGNLEIYVIPDTQPLYKKRIAFHKNDEPWFRWQDLVKTLVITLLSTLVGFAFFAPAVAGCEYHYYLYLGRIGNGDLDPWTCYGQSVLC